MYKSEKLKSCPFCGMQPKVSSSKKRPYCEIFCNNDDCPAEVIVYVGGDNCYCEAVKAWNARSETSKKKSNLEERISVLERIIHKIEQNKKSKTIFHGKCIGCARPSIFTCVKCMCFDCDWDLPDMSIKPEDQPERNRKTCFNNKSLKTTSPCLTCFQVNGLPNWRSK